MKTKVRDFIQHLHHEVEDEDEAERYLDNALPSIGLIVMYFNSLESVLDSVLCENFTDRSDSTGLIVLNKMNYSAKVDLLKRFCDDFQVGLDRQLEGYEQLINDLNESGRLRNLRCSCQLGKYRSRRLYLRPFENVEKWDAARIYSIH